MYSQNLQEYIQQIGNYAQVSPESVSLLEESLACFTNVLGEAINARTKPQGDLLNISVRLILLSNGLARLGRNENLDGAHYLVGLGFEQTGELLARFNAHKVPTETNPLESDLWYRLSLAFLHYLAGGYRVQALSVLRHLGSIAFNLDASEHQHIGQYRNAHTALKTLYSGRKTAAQFLQGVNVWYDLFFDRTEPNTHSELRIQQLAQQIRQRRDTVLANLGEGNEANWLSKRKTDSSAAPFWSDYLASLDRRGITAFTKEQAGPGFDAWLRSGNDLLVVLPTGSGKTIIGELRSALAIAQGKQVLWMLPTRALVRQIRRELRRAFDNLNVAVEELPTTEDFIPLFAENIGQPHHIAATTPEKLAALLRYNPNAVENVGLVVFDEAQILLKESRGTTAEFVLQQIRRRVPSCDIVLMTAFGDIKDSLEQFLRKLGRNLDFLVSDSRPTRRIYGVLTNDYVGKRQFPTVLLYPPGIQSVNTQTENPFVLVLDKPLPSTISPTDTAHRFVKATTTAGIRTALFVRTIVSTETQAIKIAKGQQQTIKLPEQDTARMHVELGRSSVIEDTYLEGVAPHHAGLTPLEQTLVEKWLRNGILKTVIATPTLAEGVNLPFDLSIVTYVSRSTQTETNKPIPPREILNMLGRAGRAGHVSDGIGLLSIKSDYRSAIKVLDDSRRFFFQPQKPSNEYLGLSRLVKRALQAKVDASDWLVELGDLNFSEIQTLVTFVCRVAFKADNIKQALADQLRLFPSMQRLNEQEIEQVTLVLEKLAQNIQHQVVEQDPTLATVLERTGMPIEVLNHFLSQLQTIDATWMQSSTQQDQMLWADQVVREALENCSSRKWYRKLVKTLELEKIFSTILLWRSGLPMIQLEKNWQPDQVSEKRNRIALGKFINHQLSLFAQFWGALAVCYEEVFGLHDRERLGLLLQQLPTFTREGVSSLAQLEWLRAIGGLDRVLAHELVKVEGIATVGQSSIRHQVRRWRERQQVLPTQLDEKYSIALRGVLNL
jgi:hypothetical protein